MSLTMCESRKVHGFRFGEGKKRQWTGHQMRQPFTFSCTRCEMLGCIVWILFAEIKIILNSKLGTLMFERINRKHAKKQAKIIRWFKKLRPFIPCSYLTVLILEEILKFAQDPMPYAFLCYVLSCIHIKPHDIDLTI